MLNLGVKIKLEKTEINKLNGKTFVFSGGLETLSRDEAKKFVRNMGGKISSSVSKDLDYLVLGDEPGSKYEKAKKLNINILNENEFKKIIGL